MANERNTENLVRNMLRDKGYYDDPNIIIEEQQSKSPRIQKLLSKASKKGVGRGRPEFIIRFKDNPNDLIIIECKALTSDHQSIKKDKPTKYAVDGALLYADYLRNEFNVTAVGISGETEQEKKISTFLWLKEGHTYTRIKEDVFLTASEIHSAIDQQQEPISQEQLVKTAIKYNEQLHSYSIPEVERCTFISSILVALQDEPFLRSYEKYSNNKALLEALYIACKNVLNNNFLSQDKIDVILSEYKKFQHNKTLISSLIKKRKEKQQQENRILKEIISDFVQNILPSVRKKQFDILGKFYTQFIRYAGGDSKTGLVLTPEHITDFFCDIANLSQNDIVFDPCCGTGGFLVSAMNYMLDKARYSQVTQKQIKSTQLIGIEKRTDMFSHACSNMMMRGDGKSHIYNGDCFAEDLKKSVKEKAPNVTFLNPPYQDGNAAEQLEFLENALECIQINGTGIAICQMSTVVSTKKYIIEVRRRLLKKHTLNAVFSMPDDLFHPIGVTTCILVFQADKPHSDKKESFFGYFKNDGFVKRKHKGRIDYKDQWQSIKQKWLDAYMNSKKIPGLSITQKVKAEDEWCAEAYMETDYSTLTDKDFIKAIKEYITFQFSSGKYIEISMLPHISAVNSTNNIISSQYNRASLDDKEWVWFYVSDIFEISLAKTIHKQDIENFNGECPYVSRTRKNNGVDEYVSSIGLENFINTGDVITIGGEGIEPFYQKDDFLAGNNINILKLKSPSNIYIQIFLCTILKMDMYRYNYGRGRTNGRIKAERFKIPVDQYNNPDWKFIEYYIKSLPYSSNLK